MKINRWTLALRPKHFSDVIGQEGVSKYFQFVLNSWFMEKQTLPVGALFCGQSGVGKTTLARVIASSLNCEARTGVEPCGECSSCLAIHSGSGGGVYEIDASFFGLVDNIRTLRERLLSYSFSSYQVVILDECHMMSKESFNVLLKLFEEVPKNVFFVLITTEREKVLETVRSRLLEFRFTSVSPGVFLDYVKKLFTLEKIACPDDLVVRMYRKSKGNIRDTLMSLEHVATLGAGKITPELVAEVFGDSFLFEKLVKLLESGKFRASLELYNQNKAFYASFEDFFSLFFSWISDAILYLYSTGGSVGFYSSLLHMMYRFSGSQKIRYGCAAEMFFLETTSELGITPVVVQEKPLVGKEILQRLLDKKS
jgi:DNA polymerase III subunit gamma/tau